ncbi:MAG: ArnT family glycosyltransferase [Candidatus Kapaibacterium sp.]
MRVIPLTPMPARPERRAVIVVAIVFIAVNLVGLIRSPLPWVDEATLNDAAREWVNGGRIRSVVFSDVPAFSAGYYWQPPMQMMVSAGFYSVAGFGMWQTRIPPLLFGAASLVMLGLILHRFRVSSTVIAIVTSLLAVDPLFSFLARSGRMDTMCLFFLLVAIHCSLRAVDTSRAVWSVAAGMAIGAAGMSHPIAVGMSAGLILAHALRLRARPLLTLLLIASAAVLPLLWVSFAWFSGGWSAFTAQFLQHGSDHLVSSSMLQRLSDEASRYLRDYARAPFVPFIHLVALVMFVRTAWQRRHEDSMILILCLVSAFVFNVLFMTKEVGFYVLYPGAIAVMMLGVVVSDAERDMRAMVRYAVRSVVAVLAVILLVVGPGARIALTVAQWTQRDPDVLKNAVERAVPRGARVFGDGLLWYAAHDLGYDFTVDDYYMDKAYPHRRERRAAEVDYLILEKKQTRRANLSACSLVDSITVTAPSLLGAGRSDTLYAIYVFRTFHRTEGRGSSVEPVTTSTP